MLMLICIRDLGEDGHWQGCFSDGCVGDYLGLSWWCYFKMLLVKWLVPLLSLFKLWCTFPSSLPHPWHWALLYHGDANRIRTPDKSISFQQITYLRYADLEFKQSLSKFREQSMISWNLPLMNYWVQQITGCNKEQDHPFSRSWDKSSLIFG